MPENLGDALLTLRANAKQLYKDLGNAERKTTERIKGIGKRLTKTLTPAVAAIGAVVFKTSETINEAFATIRTGTGATGKALKGLQSDFKAVLGSVPADTQTVATAISDLNTTLGLTGEDLRRAARAAIELSHAVGTDTSGLIDETAQAMKAFGESARDPVDIMNRMFVVSQATNVPIADLTQTMSRYGQNLAAAGVQMDEAIALLGNMHAQGLPARTTMSGLSTALKKLADDGQDVTTGLRDLFSRMEQTTDSTEGIAIASEYFGITAGPAMFNAIQNGVLDLGDLTTAMGNAQGAIEKNAKATRTATERLQMLRQEVGEKIAGAFMVLPVPLQLAAAGLGAVAAAIGPLLIALPGLVVAIKGVRTALATFTLGAAGPIGLAILGIGALAGSIALLVRELRGGNPRLEGFRDRLTDAADALEHLTGMKTDVEALVQSFKAEGFRTQAATEFAARAVELDLLKAKAEDLAAKLGDVNLDQMKSDILRAAQSSLTVKEIWETITSTLEGRLSTAIARAADGMGEVGEETDGSTAALEEHGTALQELLSGYEEGKARTEALRTAEHDLERARIEQTLAVDDQERARIEQTLAVDDQEEAQLSWNKAVTKSEQLNADDTASQEDREAALRDVEASLRDLEQADNQLEAANAKVETTFQRIETAVASAAAEIREVEQSINDLHKELGRELALDADTSERFNLSLTVAFAEIDLSDAETALQEAKDRFAEAMTPEETLEALIGVHDATEVWKDATLAYRRALRASKDMTKERLGEIAEMRKEFRDNELTLQDVHNQDMREMEDAHEDALLQIEDDRLKARAQAEMDYMEDVGDWHEDHFKTLQGLEEDAARRRGQAIARYNQGQSAKLLAYQQDVETAERDHLQTLADIRRDARQSEEDAELDRQRSTEDANLEYQRSVEELHRKLAEEFFDTPDADILAAAGQVGARTDLIEALNEGLAELEIEQKQELEDIDRKHGRTLEDIQIERRRKEAEAEQDWQTKRGEVALAFQQKRLADETAHRNSLTAMQTESDRRIAEFKSASLEKLEGINKAHHVRLREIEVDAQTAVTERTVQYNKDRAIAQDTWDTESAARFEAHLETFTGLVDEWGGDMAEAVRTALQRAVDEAVRITPNVPPAQVAIPGKTSVTRSDFFGPGDIAWEKRNAARTTVPRFALGGLITSPTLLMAGERDTEAIIPLDRMESLIGGGNRGTEIHIHGDLYGYDDFAQKVGEAEVYLDRGGRQKVLR